MKLSHTKFSSDADSDLNKNRIGGFARPYSPPSFPLMFEHEIPETVLKMFMTGNGPSESLVRHLCGPSSFSTKPVLSLTRPNFFTGAIIETRFQASLLAPYLLCRLDKTSSFPDRWSWENKDPGYEGAGSDAHRKPNVLIGSACETLSYIVHM